MEMTTENYNQSKCSVVTPITIGYIYKTLPHLRSMEHCRRGCGKTKSQRIREFAAEFYLFVMSEAIPIKYHQQDCPNMR